MSKFITAIPTSIFKNKAEEVSSFFMDNKKENIVMIELISKAVFANKNYKKNKVNDFEICLKSNQNIKSLKLSKKMMNEVINNLKDSVNFETIKIDVNGVVKYSLNSDLLNEKFFTMDLTKEKVLNSNNAFIASILTKFGKTKQYFNVYFMITACKFKRTNSYKDAKKKINDMFKTLEKNEIIKSFSYNASNFSFDVIANKENVKVTKAKKETKIPKEIKSEIIESVKEEEFSDYVSDSEYNLAYLNILNKTEKKKVKVLN